MFGVNVATVLYPYEHVNVTFVCDDTLTFCSNSAVDWKLIHCVNDWPDNEISPKAALLIINAICVPLVVLQYIFVFCVDDKEG